MPYVNKSHEIINTCQDMVELAGTFAWMAPVLFNCWMVKLHVPPEGEFVVFKAVWFALPADAICVRQ